MSQKTHFIVQIDEHGFYKLKTLKARHENHLHHKVSFLFASKDILSLMIPIQEIYLFNLFVNLYHFKKPSCDGYEWMMLNVTKVKGNKNEKYVFILQRTIEGKYMPIPIHDIHKMPQKLISYDKTGQRIVGSKMDYMLHNKTKGGSMLHNDYNKTISLFSLMLDSIDLNKIGKKRRFH